MSTRERPERVTVGPRTVRVVTKTRDVTDVVASLAVDADQPPRAVPGPGHDHGRAAAAGEPQAAEQLVHIAGQAAAADVNRAHVQLTQPGGKLLLVPRPGVDDPQPPPERRPQRGAG